IESQRAVIDDESAIRTESSPMPGCKESEEISSEVEIVPLSRQPKDVHRFLQVSYGIYRHDPLWVAPLLMDLKKVFSDRNPLFQHAEMNLWVATCQGRDVGRIAGILDRAHNETQHDSAAFFGFFESI